MHVPEILEPPFRIHHRKVNIQVPVVLLRTFDETDEVVHRLFEFGGVFERGGGVGEEVGCCFDPGALVLAWLLLEERTGDLPFTDVGFPEEGRRDPIDLDSISPIPLILLKYSPASSHPSTVSHHTPPATASQTHRSSPACASAAAG